MLELPVEPDADLARIAARASAASAVLLGGSVGLELVVVGGPLPWLAALGALGLAVATIVERYARTRLARRERIGQASYLRLVRGLSRSLSPDAVVAAIVDELRHSTGADHVVVTRARPPDGSLEAVLFAAAGDAPPGTTFLPGSLLEGGRPDAVAARVAAHLREAYGLRNVLAVPLVTEGAAGQRAAGRSGAVVGTLTVSRRTARPWPPTVRELLEAAAVEVAAALVRVYAFQAAEARANLDALTGLPNRRHLDDLGRALTQGRRRGDRLGLLMIDIDHFKRLNDRHGHQTGDVVLRLVARAIAASVRADDTPARYGGEEFAVVLRQARPEQAVEVAERIRAAVTRLPVEELGVEGPVTVSVGVALAASAAEPLFGLVERADRALFGAKRAGRDRVVVDGLGAPSGPDSRQRAVPAAADRFVATQ